MKPHDPNPETVEQAALYAAGALAADECAQFERELASPDVAAALASFQPVVEMLAGVVPEATPPRRVRAALMQRITKGSASKAEAPEVFVQHQAEAAWQDIGIPGLRLRQLFVDPERQLKTFLVRLEPGCTIPAHPHYGPEDCYVLEGDYHTYGKSLRAGDYIRAPAGMHHGPSRSERGCLLLVTSATADTI